MLRTKIRTTVDQYKAKLKRLRQTSSGQEVPDPTPIAPPIGYKKQPSMVEHIRNMVRSEKLAAEARAAGLETFEEADDFDVPDDDFPVSPYEVPFEVDFEPPAPSEKVVPKASSSPPAAPAEGGGGGAGSQTSPPPTPPPAS